MIICFAELIRNYCCCFQLNFCRIIQQIINKNHTHRRIMLPHQVPPNFSKLWVGFQIGGFVNAKCGDQVNVLWETTCIFEHSQNITKCLLKLRGDFFTHEVLLGIPAHLSGFNGNSVGIANWGFLTIRK